MAHSSRGLGHLPLKEEITGSNPVCATNGIQMTQLQPVFFGKRLVWEWAGSCAS